MKENKKMFSFNNKILKLICGSLYDNTIEISITVDTSVICNVKNGKRYVLVNRSYPKKKRKI